jgi:hypothetical protein
MTPSNLKARVTLASGIVDAIELPAGVRTVERIERGRTTSVILEGTSVGLAQLQSRVSDSNVRKDERERAAKRILEAAETIETGTAADAASAREKVAAKVAKLLEKARSTEDLGNAEEAATFAAKADELLIKFELGLSEVEYAAIEESDPMGTSTVDFRRADAEELPNPQWKHAPRLHTNQRREWQEDLCVAVAKAFFCKILVQPGTTNVILVGRESHRQMAEYVMINLVRQCLRHGERAYWEAVYAVRRKDADAPATDGFKAAFNAGFTSAVSRRLAEQRAADLKQAREQGSDGKALIRLDNAWKAVERFFEEKVPHKTGTALNGSWSSNSAGHAAGAAAGSQASIRANGLSSGGRTRGPLALGSGS